MKIWRTLKDMKKLVSDVMLANPGTDEEDVTVCIDLTPQELAKAQRNVAYDLIVGVTKEYAKADERTKDFTDKEWDTFEMKVSDEIMNGIDFTKSCPFDDEFFTSLQKKALAIVDYMQASFYEVEVELEFQPIRVTIPIKARTKEDAEEYAENMPYSDIHNYMDEDDVEISSVTVEDTDNVDDDYYRDYEDAT